VEGVLISFQKNIGIMRWSCAGVAFVTFIAASYYYSQFFLQYQAATRMETLVDVLESRSVKRLNPATRQYMQRLYEPAVAQSRKTFLDHDSYWKNIYKYYYLAAISWLREGETVEALKALRQGIKYHPFFLNSYKLLWYIYGSLHLDKRAKACETVYRNILSGKVIPHDVMRGCISSEGYTE